MTDTEFKETFREVLGVSDVIFKPNVEAFKDIWDEIRKKETTAYVFTEKCSTLRGFSQDNKSRSVPSVRVSVD